MTHAVLRPSPLSAGIRGVIGAGLLLGACTGTVAATAESPVAVSSVPNAQPGTTGRQLWRLGDYTTIELVARERGAPPNEQPWRIDAPTLQSLLQSVEVIRAGVGKPLFAREELDALVSPLIQALANARPDQDVALVSSARHEDNTFFSLTAVAARLFVVDGRLNLIVHDARRDFYDTARGTGFAPSFMVGSRTEPGVSTLQGEGATKRRADWLVLSVPATAAPAVSAGPAAAAPMATAPLASPPAAVDSAPSVPVRMAPGAPGSSSAVLAPMPSSATAPAASHAAAPISAVTPGTTPGAIPASIPTTDPEQRLVTLKRLFDKGLITRSEYEHKRQEILKGL